MLELTHVFQDFLEQGGQILLGGLREVQDGDFFLQFRWDLHDRRDDDNGLKTVFEMQRDILKPPNDANVASSQERVEIFEQENRRLDLVNDEVQRRSRFFGGSITAALGLNRR